MQHVDLRVTTEGDVRRLSLGPNVVCLITEPKVSRKDFTLPQLFGLSGRARTPEQDLPWDRQHHAFFAEQEED
jgi:hypothetical protein